MYPLSLTTSHVPPQPGPDLLQITVGGLLRRCAASNPDKVILIEVDAACEPQRRFTAAGILARSEALARRLARDYAPGTRLALMAPNCPEWVIVEFAAALAGLVLVSVNPAYQKRELDYVLRQSGARALFIVGSHRGNPIARIAQETAAAIPDISEITDIEDAAALAGRPAADQPLPVRHPDQAVQIQYTSGTTGFPKGVMLHHRGLINNAALVFGRMGGGADDVILNMMPMFHTGGCGVMTLGTVALGATMVLARQFDAAGMNRVAAGLGVTLTLGVPTMLTAMLQAAAAGGPAPTRLRTALLGGAPVAPELVRRLRREFSCRVQVIFGQTESSPVLTQTWLDDADALIEATSGQPLPHTEIAIRAPGGTTPLPLGETGEICARAPWVMQGYFNNAEATEAAIDADGWLRTGDLGCLTQQGYLRITGRVRDMIIRGGENIFPAEIEHVLMEHPDVAEAAVIGVPDPFWGETVAAFLRLRPGAKLDAPALTAHCRAQIAAPKTPQHWRTVEQFPLTPSGKI